MQADENLMQSIVAVARQAGDQILNIYRRDSGIEVQTKDDESPLTEADTLSHRHVIDSLQELTPELPVLSEESDDVPYKTRKHWSAYWLVDPLDGTKEFINRNDEFTVNIALVRDNEPVMGVVHAPALGITYFGIADQDAWRQRGQEEAVRIHGRAVATSGALGVVVSRSHGNEALEAMLEQLGQTFSGLERVNMGSSLKVCLLAEGKADLYPRLGPTSEWDTAAAHAILRASGGDIYTTDFQPLTYNTRKSLINPEFIAVGDRYYPWRQILT